MILPCMQNQSLAMTWNFVAFAAGKVADWKDKLPGLLVLLPAPAKSTPVADVGMKRSNENTYIKDNCKEFETLTNRIGSWVSNVVQSWASTPTEHTIHRATTMTMLEHFAGREEAMKRATHMVSHC
eukprot:jgi/Ulvmu1/6285/UM028_0146.1